MLKGELVVTPVELGVANFITGAVSGIYTPQGVYNDDPDAKKFFTGITYYQDGIVVASLTYDAAKHPHLAKQTISASGTLR